MWLFVPRNKFEMLKRQVDVLEEDAEFKDKELSYLQEDLDMAEECLKNLRDNKIDALLCQSLFSSLRTSVDKSLYVESKDKHQAEAKGASIDESQNLFKTSGDTLSQINEELKAVSGRAHASQFALSDLSKSTMKIERLLRTIQQVMTNTRLLSLNAQVDAARAEVETRDIVEVTREIALLATQSTDAASEIAELIKVIKGQTDDAQSQVNELIDLTFSLGLTASTVEDVVDEIVQSAKSYRRTISKHRLSNIFRKAQWEHVSMKSKLCEKLLGNETHHNYRHDGGDFSQWLADVQEQSSLATMPEFKHMLNSHNKMHQIIDYLWHLDKSVSSDDMLTYIKQIDEHYAQFVDNLNAIIDIVYS